MENITKWSEGKREAAHEGKNSGRTKLDLAERGVMDRQLAAVASTKFDDVHVGLLDEIFHFSDLLRIRR